MVPEERGVHPRGNFESLAETLSSQRKKLNYLFSAFSATLRDIWFTHAAMAIGEKNAIFFCILVGLSCRLAREMRLALPANAPIARWYRRHGRGLS